MIPTGRKHRLKLLLISFLLSASSVALAQNSDGQEAEESKQVPESTVTPPPAPADTSDEIALKVWSAEVLGSEGEFEKAATEYLAAAFMSQDPEISRRAAQVAISAQSWETAAMAADRWALLDPDNIEARETAARTLLLGGDLVRAEYQLSELLKLTVDEPWGGWRRLSPLLAVSRDAGRTDEMLKRLEAEAGAEKNPYVKYVRSQVLARGSNFEPALALAKQAASDAPAETQLQSWAGRLSLTTGDEAGAQKHYEAAWRTQPDNRQLAMVYAELLRQTGRPDDALDVIATLPATPANRFTQVAFATESGNRQLAVDIYEGFETETFEDPNEAAFQAARAAEVLDLKEDAIGWYARVDGGDNELISILRQAYLLSEMDRLDDARQLLLFARNSGSTVVQMETTLVEAQILSEAAQEEEAFAVLGRALEQFPDDSRLLYTRSLIAVQLGKVDQAEADLRTVLANEPSNAAALNALGYTLADLTDRLDEAERLIRQAFALEPDDAAIIDSMGWVLYRQGKLEESMQYLRQAFMRDRNAEIAAHLGEVLFMMGNEGDAKRVFNEGRRIDPDDKVLMETIERLGVDVP